MSFLHTITNSGLTFVHLPSEKRGVYLSNIIGLIITLLSLVLMVSYYAWYGWNVVTGSIPVMGVLSMFTIVLNRFGFTVASRVWVSLFLPILTMSISIYSKSIYYHLQEELDYFTFRFIILGSCIFPLILFSLTEKSFLVLCSCIAVSILMAHDPLHHYFGVGYRQDNLKESNYTFTNIVILVTYCILMGAILFLKWVLETTEKRNDQLIDALNNTNEVLVEKNAEIEAQSAEILAQSDNLQANQNKLLQAYRVIHEQKGVLVNENKNLESELVQKNKDLIETNTELIKHNTELRQFSYTVSHNLRGPVASLLGLIGLIDSKKIAEDEASIFKHISTSTERLDVIIRDLSKIIDIRHDIFQIRQKINLEHEIKEVTQLLRKEIEIHQVKIITRIKKETATYSIRPMLHSILYNLISNAIKYRSSERDPIVEINAYENQQFYFLEIKDNGLGIDLKKNSQNLFKLYKRFHFHTEGKGLGLYLVKLQAESLGGSIEVESEMNRFTKFTVRIAKTENVERQSLYKEPHAEIFFDAQLNCTGVVWQGPLTSDQYRVVFQKCLEFVKMYNAPNYITDLSHQGYISKEDQMWMFHTILPDATKNGMRRIAAVRPDVADPGVQEYLKGINETLVKLGARQEFFLTMKEAMDWIQHENEIAILQHEP
jgi:signal transduction histidine kinase